MKTTGTIKYLYLLAILLLLPVFAACDDFDIEDINTPSSGSTIKSEVNFDIQVIGYDNDGQTRATEWKSGDEIYLDFGKYGICTAVYINNKWIVERPASLPSSGKFSATYFQNAGKKTGKKLSLSEKTAVYSCKDASYELRLNKMYITCALSPMLARVRFQSDDNEDMLLRGVKRLTSFDTATGEFNFSDSQLSLSANDKNDNFYYLLATDDKELTLFTRKSAWSMPLRGNAFMAGEAGVIKLPQGDNYYGWNHYVTFKYKKGDLEAAEIVMIPVNYNNSYFLLAQTEFTWHQAVIFGIEFSANEAYDKPYTPRGLDRLTVAINKMVDVSGMPYRFPTLEEWTVAAKAGKNYTYSGSNTIGEVAWYKVNSGSKKDVALLKSNDWGFYDMSGNAWEQVGESDVIVGGCARSSADDCTILSISSRHDISLSNNYLEVDMIGMRPALDNPFNW